MACQVTLSKPLGITLADAPRGPGQCLTITGQLSEATRGHTQESREQMLQQKCHCWQEPLCTSGFGVGVEEVLPGGNARTAQSFLNGALFDEFSADHVWGWKLHSYISLHGLAWFGKTHTVWRVAALATWVGCGESGWTWATQETWGRRNMWKRGTTTILAISIIVLSNLNYKFGRWKRPHINTSNETERIAGSLKIISPVSGTNSSRRSWPGRILCGFRTAELCWPTALLD